MNKLKAFTLLDFVTLKPYLTVKNLLIFGVCVIFLSGQRGMLETSFSIGFMLGTLFISYPFAVGEKSNLDALYATLSVDRKTVVLGRYIFLILLDICAVAFSFLFTTIGVFGARLANIFQGESGSSLSLNMVMSAVLLLIQTIQLPIYFKLGYTKARFLNILPLAVIFACLVPLVFLTSAGRMTAVAHAFLSGISINGAIIAALVVLVLAIAVYVSYTLSVAFYKRREF